MENSEFYEYLEEYKINDESILFTDKRHTYKISMYDIISYIEDYSDPDAYICDQDGLCDFIDALAEGYDLQKLTWLFEDLDSLNINNDWFVVDCNFNVDFFNDLEELGMIYDLEDILEDMLEYNRSSEYCMILGKEEY